MITLICDQCESPISVADDQAGSKIKCPNCGDVNLIPLATAGARDTGPATGIHSSSGPESRVLFIRPAMFRSHPISFSLLFLIAFGGIVASGVLALSSMVPWAIASLLAGLGAAGTLAVWRITKYTASLTITTRRTIETKGLLSKATTEVLHHHITNLQITQTFWNRIWGVGTIGISSSAQDGVEIVMEGVTRPYAVRDTIDKYRNL